MLLQCEAFFVGRTGSPFFLVMNKLCDLCFWRISPNVWPNIHSPDLYMKICVPPLDMITQETNSNPNYDLARS